MFLVMLLNLANLSLKNFIDKTTGAKKILVVSLVQLDTALDCWDILKQSLKRKIITHN